MSVGILFCSGGLGCSKDRRERSRQVGPSQRDSGVPEVGTHDGGPDDGEDAGDAGGGVDAEPQADGGPDGGMDGGGLPCGESPCKLTSPQCGCPAGEGCYLDGDLTRICSTAGTAEPGASCEDLSECQPGSLCIGSPGALFCRTVCEDHPDCTGGPGSRCVSEVRDGTGAAPPAAVVCTIHCDPVDNDGCPSENACRLYADATDPTRHLTDCTRSGTGGAGGRASKMQIVSRGSYASTQAMEDPARPCAGWAPERPARLGSVRASHRRHLSAASSTARACRRALPELGSPCLTWAKKLLISITCEQFDHRHR